jgi:hypothetical protein
MTVIKKSDVKQHLSKKAAAKRRASKLRSQPDATGYSEAAARGLRSGGPMSSLAPEAKEPGGAGYERKLGIFIDKETQI